MQVRTFRDLKVWGKAHELALAVYRETARFPKDELYGLVSQLRRSAVSTAANIVEGSKRKSRPDFGHFLNIAECSNEEVKYLLELSADLGFLPRTSLGPLIAKCDEVGAMLHAFIQGLKPPRRPELLTLNS